MVDRGAMMQDGKRGRTSLSRTRISPRLPGISIRTARAISNFTTVGALRRLIGGVVLIGDDERVPPAIAIGGDPADAA
jgi:hypothetical protein